MSVKTWMKQIRSPFLLLPVVLTMYGIALAYFQSNGNINWDFSILAGFGLVALHISVNVFNEYFDYKSGIDFETNRTPFSGGSGVLPAGENRTRSALLAAIFTLVLGGGIGFYLFTKTGWPLLILGIIGVVIVVSYTSFLSKIMVGEIAAGLGLGTLPVLGIQYVNTLTISTDAIIAAVPSGFLVFNLLLLNEFPDADADKKGGRRHLVIVFGKKIARWIYTSVGLGVFIWISVWVIFDRMPIWALLSLLILPVCIRACVGAIRDYNSFEKLIPAQGMNVMVTLVTQVLLAIGYYVSTL
jgi:1,4-dihydroxy-2-naphthoate octaprenyltransferase